MSGNAKPRLSASIIKRPRSAHTVGKNPIISTKKPAGLNPRAAVNAGEPRTRPILLVIIQVARAPGRKGVGKKGKKRCQEEFLGLVRSASVGTVKNLPDTFYCPFIACSQ